MWHKPKINFVADIIMSDLNFQRGATLKNYTAKNGQQSIVNIKEKKKSNYKDILNERRQRTLKGKKFGDFPSNHIKSGN